jgi:formylglycine-generating enzyme required for sulfatase activity
VITRISCDRTVRRRGRESARRASASLVFLLGLATTPGLAQQPAKAQGTHGLEPYTERIQDANVSIDMVPVPAGKVQIETPQGVQTVEVGPFWMTKTEIPWDIYDVWVFGSGRSGGSDVDAVSGPTKPYVLPGDNLGFGHQGHPAVGMTAFAAERFAEWFSARTGKKYRLPTEAEWRLACQAGSGKPQPSTNLDKLAWYAKNSERRTHPVGTTAPNAFGIHDLLGNAGEWVIGADGEPVVMGGAYDDDARDVHCAAKKKQTDAWNATDPQLPKSRWWLSDAPFVGLRLVREPDGQ